MIRIIVIVIISSLLGSCGNSRNFNSQKFTKLKKINSSEENEVNNIDHPLELEEYSSESPELLEPNNIYTDYNSDQVSETTQEEERDALVQERQESNATDGDSDASIFVEESNIETDTTDYSDNSKLTEHAENRKLKILAFLIVMAILLVIATTLITVGIGLYGSLLTGSLLLATLIGVVLIASIIIMAIVRSRIKHGGEQLSITNKQRNVRVTWLTILLILVMVWGGFGTLILFEIMWLGWLCFFGLIGVIYGYIYLLRRINKKAGRTVKKNKYFDFKNEFQE